jgi:hypothetical protein
MAALTLAPAIVHPLQADSPAATVPATGAATVPSIVAPAPMPRVYAPVRSRETEARYPWKTAIPTTIFWIGEQPTANNPTPNHKSSWDPNWAANYGGTDHPDPELRTWDFCPRAFRPGLNPFYVALPYNDIVNSKQTKPEAARVIPWFKDTFQRQGSSVCKGRWVAIRYGKRTCYAQWEDCGPFNTNDWRYVFGSQRPKTTNNGGAGLDVAPAVRDYLGIGSGALCDWRFVDLDEVPDGPWRRHGENNHFVQSHLQIQQANLSRLEDLKRQREIWLRSQAPGS